MYFPDKFDLKKARELALLVIEAYNQFSTFKEQSNWILGNEYKLIQEFYYKGSLTNRVFENEFAYKKEIMDLLGISTDSTLGEPFGFIASKKNNIYVIFRGTMTITEWMKNLDFDLKPYSEKRFGKVHEGFLVIYESLKESIFKSLKSIPKIKNIYISGHSLGGAISTLLVPFISNNFKYKSINVYTFGSPRVGNKTFVETYNKNFSKNTFRIQNTSDMVVSVPFPVGFMGIFRGSFTHVDTPVTFTIQKGDMELNHEMELYYEALNSANSQSRIFKIFKLLFSFNK